MAYGIDFRKRVIAYKNSGHSKQETCKVFGISRNTLYLWEKQLETLGTLEISPRKRKPFKIPLDQLEAYVEAHPDAFLREIAEQFNCRPQSVWMALKKIGITLKKKTTSYREQDPEKVRRFLAVLSVLAGLPIVYIDETGIDTYLYRKRARAKRGRKILGKVSGRRFERISLVAGQIEGKFIAPMIYKESMTSDFFLAWFQNQLLPALDKPHIVIMDNASFHPKNQLDQLCLAEGHYFLPLPPYSPELNPIEKAWANLKRAITELLKT
ncbi:IS630 family transposase, partial [Streptococcus acidominimus]|uniref:IS630 family transposase n=1 Tax=Streptococcus acidominimus TaxID=1326 RepID=UPI002240ED7F